MTAGRLATAAVAALVLSPLLAACGTDSGGGPGGNVTITFVWWGSDGRANITKQAVELFQQTQPDHQGRDLVLGLRGLLGEARHPDGRRQAARRTDHRHPLPRRIRRTQRPGSTSNDGAGKAISLAEVNPELATTGVYQGKRYAVPWAQNTPPDALRPRRVHSGRRGPGKGLTWDAVRRRRREGQRGRRFQRPRVTDFGILDRRWRSGCANRASSSTPPRASSASPKTTCASYWQLASRFRDTRPRHRPTSRRPTTPRPSSPRSARSSPAPSSPTTTSCRRTRRRTAKPLNVAPYPTDTAGDTGQYRRPSMFLSVSARSQQQEAAAKLVDFLVNDPEVGKIVGTDRGLAPNLKVRAQLAGAATGNDKTLYDYEAALEPQARGRAAGAAQGRGRDPEAAPAHLRRGRVRPDEHPTTRSRGSCPKPRRPWASR